MNGKTTFTRLVNKIIIKYSVSVSLFKVQESFIPDIFQLAVARDSAHGNFGFLQISRRPRTNIETVTNGHTVLP